MIKWSQPDQKISVCRVLKRQSHLRQCRGKSRPGRDGGAASQQDRQIPNIGSIDGYHEFPLINRFVHGLTVHN
jgi:hypothetical protein